MTLAETIIAASIFIILAGFTLVMLIDSAKFYSTGMLQDEQTRTTRHLTEQLQRDAVGTQFYGVLNNFQLKQAATSGGTCLMMAQMDNMLETAPKIRRVIVYYLEPAKTGGAFHTLRRIDSAAPTSADLKSWAAQFPTTLRNDQAMSELLPPATTITHGKSMAQIDSTQGAAQIIPEYQLFYPLAGCIEVNLLTRYGNNTRSYLAPIQISIVSRR